MKRKNKILTIGDRIRFLRESRRITPEIFSEKFGISQVTLNRYEKGHRVPDANFLMQMVDEFDYDGSWLLTGQSSKIEDRLLGRFVGIVELVEKVAEEKKYDPAKKAILIAYLYNEIVDEYFEDDRDYEEEIKKKVRSMDGVFKYFGKIFDKSKKNSPDEVQGSNLLKDPEE